MSNLLVSAQCTESENCGSSLNLQFKNNVLASLAMVQLAISRGYFNGSYFFASLSADTTILREDSEKRSVEMSVFE